MAKRRVIGGSDTGAKTASHAGGTDPADRIEVTVILRSAAPIPGKVEPFEHLSRDEFAQRYGASADDIAQVTSWAESLGLEVTGTSPVRRSVYLSGDKAALDQAFDVELTMFHHGDGVRHGFHGSPSVPEHLGDIIIMVLGLHGQPLLARHIGTGAREESDGGDGSAQASAASPELERMDLRTVDKLTDFYGFPAGDGEGECVGIIEMGADCGYYRSDLDKFFGSSSKIDYEDVCVGNGRNAPIPEDFVREFADWSLGKGHYMYAAKSTAEATMDVSMIGALAPKAKIWVYFGAATEQGLLAMIQTALFDSDPAPSVISISWGFQERDIIPSGEGYVGLAEFLDEIFLSAAHLGVTICVAAGDWGAANAKDDSRRNTRGVPDVEFPASCPHVLACGGTTILKDGNEVVWNADYPPHRSGVDPSWIMHGATGGGFSRIFERPEWQNGLHDHKGRGLPDVAAVADPRCGARFVLAGLEVPFGGTSTAAPIWAGLVLRLNQALGRRVGWLNPIIYGLANETGYGSDDSPLTDVTQGDNRFKPSDEAGFSATEGWDACSGLGVPRGEKLLAALRGASKR